MSRTEFRERIRASLANETLQSALDANAERRVNGRIAFASCDWRTPALSGRVIEHPRQSRTVHQQGKRTNTVGEGMRQSATNCSGK
jgi:hypothetical protein